MSCAQFRRNDQVDQFPADSSFARVTEKTLSCDIPFTHAAVVADDDDAIECGIEDCLAVLFAGGEIVLLFACELLNCCGNEIVEERVNERLGFSARRGIEFLDIASETVNAITCNYLPHTSQFANDLLHSRCCSFIRRDCLERVGQQQQLIGYGSSDARASKIDS